MPTYVRVGGVWRTVSAPAVRISGSWRSVRQMWVRVSGVWRTCYIAEHSTIVNNAYYNSISGTYPHHTLRHHYGADAEYYAAGSIVSPNFNDGGGNARVIRQSAIEGSTASFPVILAYAFSLDGQGVPNSDTTFKSVVVNGNELFRSAATYFAGNPGGVSSWVWGLPGFTFYPNATHTLVVKF